MRDADYDLVQAKELVMLLYDQPGGHFRGGTIVEICGTEQAPHSETKRPGQPTDWTVATDANTYYRFRKREIQYNTDIVVTADRGAHIVPHHQLSRSRNGRADTTEYLAATLVYTLQDIQIFRRPQNLLIPRGTLGRISVRVTRTGSAPHYRGDAQRVVAPGTTFYAVEFMLRHAKWEETICSFMRDCHSFRKLTQQEVARYTAYQAQLPPPDTIINWV
ncbi:hypothetical protein BD413DRAFT_85180 [Trametes elegans]|nr:hypothetical protein BD413DRAFT_85180 [Trametes elegans]